MSACFRSLLLETLFVIYFQNTVAVTDEEPEENCEAMSSGSIPTSTYAEYYRHGAGLCVMLCLVVLFILAQLASNACDLWVTYWYVGILKE